MNRAFRAFRLKFAIEVAPALLVAGCGFFQDLDGYTGGGESAPPDIGAPPAAGGRGATAPGDPRRAVLARAGVAAVFDAPTPAARLYAVGGDDGDGGVRASFEATALAAGVGGTLGAWSSGALAVAAGAGAAHASVGGGLLVTGGAGAARPRGRVNACVGSPAARCAAA